MTQRDDSTQNIYDSGAPEALPGDWRIVEANRRKAVLKAFYHLIGKTLPGEIEDPEAMAQSPLSRTKAANKVANVATIWRYERAFLARGFDGLIPDISSGRTSNFELLLKDADFCAKLTEHLPGDGRRKWRERGAGTAHGEDRLGAEGDGA